MHTKYESYAKEKEKKLKENYIFNKDRTSKSKEKRQKTRGINF